MATDFKSSKIRFFMVLVAILLRVFVDMGLIDRMLARMQLPLEEVFILLLRPLTVIHLPISGEERRLVICFFVEF